MSVSPSTSTPSSATSKPFATVRTWREILEFITWATSLQAQVSLLTLLNWGDLWTTGRPRGLRLTCSND